MEFIKALKPEDLRKDIKQAAINLDNYNKEWYKKINKKTLDMKSQTCCILGQLFNVFGLEIDIFRPNYVFYVNNTEKFWIEEVENREQECTKND